MSVPTTNRNYPFPDEWKNPYYTDLWAFVQAIDQDVHNAWAAIAGVSTTDATYNNYGATPAVVRIDGAQGQGDLVFEPADTTSFVIDLEDVLGAGVDGFFIENNTDYFRFYQGGTSRLNISAVIHSYGLVGSGDWGIDVVGDVSITSGDSIEIGADGYMEIIAEEDLTIEWGDDSTWTGLSANLTIETDTSGNINLDAAGIIGINSGTTMAIDSGTTMAIESGTTLDLVCSSGVFGLTTSNGNMVFETQAGGFNFEWDVWNDCIFDLSGCTNPEAEGPGLATWRVENGTDYLELSRQGANLLNLNGEFQQWVVGTPAGTIQFNTSDFDLNATGAVHIDSATTSHFTLSANATPDQTLLISATNSGAGDGNIHLDAAGRIDIDATDDIQVTWTGLDHCVFDLSGCDNPGEGSAYFSVSNIGDSVNISRSGTSELTYEANVVDYSVYASDDFTIDATGRFSISGDETSYLSVIGASLNIQSYTSGDIVLTSVDNITLKDQYLTSAITLSESGATGSDLVGYTATSIFGAINEVRKVARYAYIPIEWANEANNDSNPPEASELYVGTTNGAMRVRKFAGTVTTDSVTIPWEVPSDIIAGDGIFVQVVGLITESTAPASGEGVVFKVSGYSVGVGDHIDGTFGTEVETADDDLYASGCTVQGERYKTDLSGEITVTNLAGGETAMLHLERDISDGDDDYEQDIGAAMLVIKYFEQATIT